MKKRPGDIIILPKIIIICYTIPEIWRMTNVIIFHFGPFFALLPLSQPAKMQKTLGDTIILQKCAKNHDHILYCSSDVARDRYNCYFSFWAIFCTFTPLTAQKIKIKKKMKKRPGDIIIFHMCSKNYDQMVHDSCDMVHNGRTDRWTDGKSDVQMQVPRLKIVSVNSMGHNLDESFL